jgi:hypothetical protein
LGPFAIATTWIAAEAAAYVQMPDPPYTPGVTVPFYVKVIAPPNTRTTIDDAVVLYGVEFVYTAK